MTSVILALAPVLLFLVALVLMDSFKLVQRRAVTGALGWGGAAAILILAMDNWIAKGIQISPEGFTRYVAPAIEETIKGAFIIFVIARRRVGFLVDAAILGFAVGTGFALVENLVYLSALGSTAPLLLWAVRGLGTAILHGATTAVLAVIAKRAADFHPERFALAWLPAWVVAFSIHSAFNHVLLPPVAQTLLLLLALPIVVVFVFHISERSTREWVGAGLDLDVALLELVESKHFERTRFGVYLNQLRSRFPGPVVADMFCLLRIELQLSVRAKALLMARTAGLELPADEDLDACLAERVYLLRSIGTTGRLALKPLRVTSGRDAWHRHLLGRSRRHIHLPGTHPLR